MKKVMFFLSMFYIGGTEKAIISLIKELKEFKKYDIYIGYNDNDSDQSILDELSRYASVIDISDGVDIEFDFLVVCSPHYYASNNFNCLKAKKLIYWAHTFNNKTTVAFDLEEECNKISTIISVSNSLTDKLKNTYPQIADKIITINNVINKDEIIEKSNIPIRLDLSPNLNLVTVARVCDQKGFSRMLYLAKCLKENKISFKWFVIGGNYYNEQEKQIKEQFVEFKDEFQWFGFLSNPHNIVKQCDYSVLLSDDETWGLVLTEAMLLQVPCIVTDFEVAFQQVINGKNGIILSRDNLDSYKDHIDDIINNKKKYKDALNDYDYKNVDILKEWEKVLE